MKYRDMLGFPKKKDAKWYLATMKKYLPKIVKKFG